MFVMLLTDLLTRQTRSRILPEHVLMVIPTLLSTIGDVLIKALRAILSRN
jgi:hypothetical protein